MPLIDHLEPLAENPICHRCGMEMKFTSRERRENGTYGILKYECPICHLRERITTRNNVRVEWALVGGMYVGIFAFLVGVLVQLAITLRNG